MGIFSKIYEFIFGPNYDKESKKLADRIKELKDQERKGESAIKKMQDSTADISWFSFNYNKKKFPNTTIYNPHEISLGLSMKDLQVKREKEEEERIKALKGEVAKCFDTIKYLIDSEEVEQAENLLYGIYPTISSLKDNSYQLLYDELLNQIPLVKEKIIEKEKIRKAKEEEERIEREAKQKEEERIRKAKEIEEEEKKRRAAKEYEEKLKREEEKRYLERERLKSLTIRKKENAQEILTYLKIKGVRYFYHFTDENNIMSIKKMGGLYSWYYCVNNDINIPNAGGDSQSRGLDTRQGLEDYVRLSFCSDHPMAYKKHKEGSKLVLLRINIEVATFKETQFSNVNAAANNNSHGTTFEDLKRVNISATQQSYVRREDDIFHEHQAECMVKTFLPIEYIENINHPERMYFF